VLSGLKVLILSLEEPGTNISNRTYANYFKINYSDLQFSKNGAQALLRSRFADMSKDDIAVMSNLRIEDMRDKSPMTPKHIAEWLDREYESTGYHPNLIYIDQMDYLEPREKYDSQWEKYAKVSFEVDDMCNHLIGGEHKFSVFVLHQLTGKMKRDFTNADISGFKGIIKPADMVFGIGKDDPADKNVTICSLKCRHTENFKVDYHADLAHMSFDTMNKAGMERMEQSKKLIKQSPKRAKYSNVPDRQQPMLPSSGGAFM
jgi:hypothetical protein